MKILKLIKALNVFLCHTQFQVTIYTPNAETIAAMLEAEQIANDPSVKRYSDVEEALAELKA